MRYSKQREIILEALKANAVHPTADHIYGLLKPTNPELSLGTVYRNLKQLSGEGTIRRISGLGNSEHFDHNTYEHAHFICEECSTIYDIDLPANFAAVVKEAAKQGLNIKSGEFVARGICKNCEEKKRS
ncbi:Fur family peroxide stress response transcriptional regulator [Elusimicrobium simillimum]|uniref:Fur family transcriptional regulator n=1 Tax=Elusimicrobium simillimum TaxID=3143438 RepID=UPI003C6EC822